VTDSAHCPEVIRCLAGQWLLSRVCYTGWVTVLQLTTAAAGNTAAANTTNYYHKHWWDFVSVNNKKSPATAKKNAQQRCMFKSPVK